MVQRTVFVLKTARTPAREELLLGRDALFDGLQRGLAHSGGPEMPRDPQADRLDAEGCANPAGTFITIKNIVMSDITMTTISKTKCAGAHLIKLK
jgi:hypothetical protein